LRYFIEIKFKGKNYHGWQIQPKAISVQKVLNGSISTILRQPVNVVGAGRTDAGVHALQFYAHFDVQNKLSEVDFVQKLNAFLPVDIVVKTVFLVSNEAHARFDALSRSYEYRIFMGRDPFLLDTTLQLYQKKLNVKMMNEAAAILLLYTNFKCFSKTKTDVKTYEVKITKAVWHANNNLLTFCITADRFLRNMVRAIVGTLIEIGLENKTKNDLVEIIKSEDRCMAGVSVPPQGLFLSDVIYPKEILKNRMVNLNKY
jgi:tRNA pseudouridine38-40 synthase